MTNHNFTLTGRTSSATPPRGVAPASHRLPPSARVGTVRLQVADLARSQAFYGHVLGLQAVEQGPGRLALYAPGGTEALIELVERPGARPVGATGQIGLYHFAVLVPTRAALASLVRHAHEIGLRMGMSDHLVSEALYFSDPDGLGIEVYADRSRSEWKWQDGQLVMATYPLDVGSLVAEAGRGPFTGVPADTRIGHVHLRVRDLGEAAAFYHEALGLDKVVWNYPGALFLSAGGYHHHVGLNTWAAGAPAPEGQDAQLLAWTLVLPDEQAVESTADSLEAAGHAVVREAQQVLARDPWGTAVALIAAPPAPTE